MENQRVRLTKVMLKNSLIALMKEKTIYKVSIKELCELAGINRSTFYKHYQTEFDLLKDIENEYLETIREYLELSSIEDTLQNLLEYVADNIEVFKLLADDTPGSSFFERLLAMSFEKMTQNEEFIHLRREEEQEYLNKFILFGALSVVKAWIAKEPRETPSQINKVLIDLFTRFY